MTPRFSIVIPTRERAHTLPFTLRTCLAQDFGDFEIIVADNFSAAPIQRIVEDLNDARIKYIRTDRPLAMTDSWDFAVAHATGEYVTLVGNDDGLLLHALTEIDRLIRMLDTKVLRWDSVCYNWPDLPIQDHAPPHALMIPLKQTDDYYPIHRRESARMIQDAANARISYTELPMIQCSAIQRGLIAELRAKAGRVFGSRSPDIFSCFAFAHLAGSYFSVDAPMTINGLSGQSNGVACIYLNGNSPIAEEFHRLNSQAKHAVHAQAPDVLVMPAAVADSFLHARDALFPHDQAFRLDRKQLAANCIREARFADDDEWRRFRAALRLSFADDANLLGWFDGEFGHCPPASLRSPRYQFKRYGGPYLYLDASDFGVANIYEAAQLCEKLLGCKRDGVNAHVVAAPALQGDVGADSSPPERRATDLESVTGKETPVADLQWVEIALSRLLTSLVPTRHMIDVGAHYGTTLEPFLNAGWTVDAFEPLEANRQELTARFAGAPGLVVRPQAASNETGTREFHLALNLDGSLHEYHHSLEKINDDPWHRKGPTVTVSTVRLDDLVARGEIPRQIGFLKIDTEGHDLAVLQGASALECDVISVEFWGDAHALGKSPSPAADMIALLCQRGYESFIAICHDGHATAALYSSLDGTRADTWGNIFFFKNANLFRHIVEHHDWLLVLAMSRKCDDLRAQLREKETQIRQLDAAAKLFAEAAQSRLKVIDELDRAARERLKVIGELDRALQEGRKVIDELERTLREDRKVIDDLERTLREDRKMIDELERTLREDRQELDELERSLQRHLGLPLAKLPIAMGQLFDKIGRLFGNNRGRSDAA